MRPPEPSCPGEARSRFKINKYGLKKPGDFIVSEGHGYPLVYIYIYIYAAGDEIVMPLECKSQEKGSKEGKDLN